MAEQVVADALDDQLSGRLDHVFLVVAGGPFDQGKTDDDDRNISDQFGTLADDDMVNQGLNQLGRGKIGARNQQRGSHRQGNSPDMPAHVAVQTAEDDPVAHWRGLNVVHH